MFGDFEIIKKCRTTNARVSEFTLDRNTLHLPIFMPVATYGAMRGVKTESMAEEIILNNTYHLRNAGRNIKEFMGWKKSTLTDSGGFQIQSLPNVKVTDDGVIFDNKLFTPENSMDIQMTLGADIMMQLDDVVNPKEARYLHEKAIERSIDWLDRAIVHINRARGTEAASTADEDSDEKAKVKKTIPQIVPSKGQVLFPIIQGGLLDDLRMKSIEEILLRKPIGLAIGGLSGGEDKGEFCSTVLFCCKTLPAEMPRYLMGVGYPEDIVVCCALGTDMSDCVYPTRTARFGRALRDCGDLMVTSKLLADLLPLDESCQCSTCLKYSRSYLATIKGTPNFCMLMSVHNMFYMRNLTRRIREAIMEDRYPEFIKEFMHKRFTEIPGWIVTALEKVGVKVN